jgi:hypothetical protein
MGPTDQQTSRSFAVLLTKLAELEASTRIDDPLAVGPDSNEIDELRQIVEDIAEPDCLEFVTT